MSELSSELSSVSLAAEPEENLTAAQPSTEEPEKAEETTENENQEIPNNPAAVEDSASSPAEPVDLSASKSPVEETKSSSSAPPDEAKAAPADDDDFPLSEESVDFIPSQGPKNSFQSRLLQFHHYLNCDSIPMEEIRAFIFDFGVPEGENLRSLIWKLLIGHLSYNHREWENSLKQSRLIYEEFVQQLTINPYNQLFPENPRETPKTMRENTENSANTGASQTGSNGSTGSSEGAATPAASPSSTGPIRKFSPISLSDNPLSLNKSSEWIQFYSDQEIRREIQKDVARTYANFHFFNERVRPIETDSKTIKEMNEEYRAMENQSSSSSSSSSAYPSSSSSSSSSSDLFHSLSNRYWQKTPIYISPPPKRSVDERHHDILERILFIYAKLNPGIRYVQGMNEILAPMYYVFAQDSTELFRGHAESDAFFCFTAIMSEIRDRFIKSLDSSPTGILSVVQELNQLLKECDYEVWAVLEKMGVDPRFYSFRWLTLLLSQEFELPEVLRLWDSLFADSERFSFLLFFCVGIIVSVRSILLQGDFAESLRILQHAGENGDFQQIFQLAKQLKGKYQEKKRKEKEMERKEKEKQQEKERLEKEKRKTSSSSASSPAGGKSSNSSGASQFLNSVGSFFKDLSSSLKS